MATRTVLISWEPIDEMRTALNEAVGVPTPPYAEGLALNQPILAVHIQELRNRVLNAWQSGGGGVDIRWLVSDQLGTPRMIFDQSGSLTVTDPATGNYVSGMTRRDYLPFGEELFADTGGRTTAQGYSASDNVRQKFTQKERDNETGLDYFLARYYSSSQGRFTSPDEFKGGPHELWVLGSGHPEKQALVYAEVTNPQSLNKYQYCFNNPLRYVDPDGQNPQDSFEIKMQQAIKDLNSGRITEQQYWERLRGAGVGAAAGVAAIVAARGDAAGLTALAYWASRNPDKLQQLAQELMESGGGPPGLTLSATSRLTQAEKITGRRLGTQLGLELTDSPHVGAEYIVAGAKNISIDAMGEPRAYQHFGDGKQFLASIDHHVNKSVDYVAIDLKGASKAQIKTIK